MKNKIIYLGKNILTAEYLKNNQNIRPISECTLKISGPAPKPTNCYVRILIGNMSVRISIHL